MEALKTIKEVIGEMVERKLVEVLPAGLKFPLPLVDSLAFRGKKVRIMLEIYEDSVVAHLAADRDIFAEGPTVRQAKANLRASLLDEYEFFLRHRKELSRELKRKLSLLQGILG